MNGEESIIEIRISPRQADEFMDRLVNDLEFRERLVQNPVEELARYGISVPPALLPEHPELPSPDEVGRARDAIDAGEFAALGGYGGDMIKFGPLQVALLIFRKFIPPSRN